MAHLNQHIKIKKRFAKNKQAKYKATSTKVAKTTTKNSNTTKQYAYTKKITVNGKTRYYYA